MDIPTWAEDAFVSGTGEVVTLAEAAVNLSKFRLEAQTLVAAALSSTAADLLALGFPAGAEVHAAGLALLALAAGAQVARLTVTNPTVISTCKGNSYFILLTDLRLIYLWHLLLLLINTDKLVD